MLTRNSDPSPSFTTATQIFTSRHPSTHTPTSSDISSLRQIASHVTQRASAVLATGVHALWALRNEAEHLDAADAAHTLVAYNGSVIEHYPNFKDTCQRTLDELVRASGGQAGAVELMYAEESSLLGAAVAVACLDG
jgi:hexokinase